MPKILSHPTREAPGSGTGQFSTNIPNKFIPAPPISSKLHLFCITQKKNFNFIPNRYLAHCLKILAWSKNFLIYTFSPFYYLKAGGGGNYTHYNLFSLLKKRGLINFSA